MAYSGNERREFVRLDYVKPLAYKVCKEETVSRLLQGYTTNVSEAGLLCNLKEKVHIGNILWLSFDRGILSICEELENKSLIYQNGIVGKVVRIEGKGNSYDVGVKFITRQENITTNIYPKVYFDQRYPEKENNEKV